MKFTIEDAIEAVLKNKEHFDGSQGANFYIAVEGTFDNAPLGVGIDMHTNEDEEGYSSWTVAVYPLVEVVDAVESAALVPDFTSYLLGFHLLFTNPEKTQLEVCISFSERMIDTPG